MNESPYPYPTRRECSRIDAYMPLDFHLVPSDEHSHLRSRISSDVMTANFNMMPPLEYHPLNECLSILNKKVDRIMEMVVLQREGFHALPFKFVTISGTGMKFPSRQCLHYGQVLEFRMILTMHHPVALYVYGKVLSAERRTDGYDITVCFIKTDSGIRDQIVQFVFEVEREMIRARKGGE